MIKTCERCGTRENIQTHHLSYDPEITQYLCVNCHQKVHGHGVGSVGFKGTNAGLLDEPCIYTEEGTTRKPPYDNIEIMLRRTTKKQDKKIEVVEWGTRDPGLQVRTR